MQHLSSTSDAGLSEAAQHARASLPPKSSQPSTSLADLQAERAAWEASVPPPDAPYHRIHPRLGYYELAGQRPGRLLYLHGGGLIAGSARTAFGHAKAIASATDLTTWVLDYALAPEHPYPVALQDLLMLVRDERLSSGPLVLAGDSSGGGLALQLTVAMLQAGVPAPAALTLLSPHLDMELSKYADDPAVELDPCVSLTGLQHAAALYAGAADRRLPTLSPCLARGLKLPPTLCLLGSTELLVRDSQQLVANNPDSPITVSIYPGLWHVWPAWTELPESRQAMAELASFVAAHTR